jgi:acetyl-CoA carboxylase biotin carboxyl carrier protein
MNFDEIRQLLDMVREHELSEFELEREGFKIRIRKSDGIPPAAVYPPAAPPLLPPPMAAATSAAIAPPAPPADEDEEIELAVVKSPIVGTFYRSPEPGAASFVNVGDVVKKGQVLCIIEAMKLMNEIDSEIDGEITNIYVENGQPVQYGERLFAIRPR